MNLLRDRDRLGGLILFVVGAAYLSQVLSIPVAVSLDERFSSRSMPFALGALLCALSLVQLLKPARAPFDAGLARWNWRAVGLLVGLMALYAATFKWLGFALGSTLFLLLGFRALGDTRYLRALLVAGGLVGGLWLLLTRLFGLYLEPGALFA